MRKGLLLVGLLVMVLVMGMSLVRADDDAPKPGTPEDNECYPGGVLYREENQDGCPSVWYWKAGWFLARFNRGLIARADFPKEFESVLPPLEEKTPSQPICATTVDGTDVWYGCANADQTGYENLNGSFSRYLLFVNDSAACPASFNGLPLIFDADTSSYFTIFYAFTPAQVASIGGLRPVTCAYYQVVR